MNIAYDFKIDLQKNMCHKKRLFFKEKANSVFFLTGIRGTKEGLKQVNWEQKKLTICQSKTNEKKSADLCL